jgi:hypothetical protein
VQENHDTYTYTARNAYDPAKVVTFTLYNNHLRVNLTGILDQAEIVAEAEQKGAEVRNQISTQVKPAVMKMIENFSGPTHISDVSASLDDEKLKVILWQRAGGLRLAPIQFNMNKVDNAEAAEAFIDELDHRKNNMSSSGKLWGPLDYWVGWAGILIMTGFLIRGLRRRTRA